MYIYTLLEALVAVVAGILIAACTKKAEHVSYGKLDKIGRITNAVQFAGVLGIGLTLLLYMIFAGNLLQYLN